ncbi:MAG: hypothetical protein IJ005_04615 [Bacteroidales bacterium]|nr:hypothetical protein [Bacteroidales bacterium]
MKRLSIMMAALLVALAGCEKEPQAVKQQQTGEEIGAGEKIYMSLKIQAVDTRSGTDNNASEGNNPNTNSNAAPEYEVGKDYENKISSVDVVLRNASKFIVASNVTPTGSDATWLATFNSSNIAEGEKYDVYIYANCSATQDLNATSNTAVSNMTQEGRFWMTNAYKAQTITVPALSTKQDEPTDLGSHFVERSMARFDYMAVNTDNAYALTGDNAGVTVTLTEAAIINQSNEFFLLRRAYESGNSGTLTIGYPELPTNYVVDTDWEAKSTAYTQKNYTTVAANFENHLSSDHTTWPWKSLSGLSVDDNWAGTDGGTTGITPAPTHGYADYKIFGYAKENTLPDVNSQVNGMSTGVVFKGQLSGDLVAAAGTADIYAFNGKLYGVWANIVTAAASDEVLKYYTTKFGDTIEEGEYEALATAGFTRYAYDTDG